MRHFRHQAGVLLCLRGTGRPIGPPLISDTWRARPKSCSHSSMTLASARSSAACSSARVSAQYARVEHHPTWRCLRSCRIAPAWTVVAAALSALIVSHYIFTVLLVTLYPFSFVLLLFVVFLFQLFFYFFRVLIFLTETLSI